MKRVVMDSSAILAWIFDEPGADEIHQILPTTVVTSANLAEILHVATVKKRYDGSSDELLESLIGMGIDVEPVVQADCVRAAELMTLSRGTGRGRLGVLLGDALCIAVAERLGLPLVGSDALWDALDLEVPYHRFR